MTTIQTVTYNLSSVLFTQSTEEPHILIITAEDEYYNTKKIGSYNFFHKYGYLTLLNGTRKEFKQWKSLFNTFFKYDEMFGWSGKGINAAQEAGKLMIKEEKKAAIQEKKNQQTNKAVEYIDSLIKRDDKILNSLEMFKEYSDEKLLELINRSFENAISKKLARDVFDAIKESYKPEITEVVTVEEVNETSNNEFPTRDDYFEQMKEEIGEQDFSVLYVAIDNEYYTMVENQAKQDKKISNKVYDSLTEGQRYHFNKHYNHRGDMVYIVKEVNDIGETTTTQQESFYLYKNTFPNYKEAYNFALNNHIPTTMIISSLHPTMTNERLQELEKEWTFSKHKMAYEDMKEYFTYISSLQVSLDQEERYYSLRDRISRKEYQQQSKQEREDKQHRENIEASKLLSFLVSKGLIIKHGTKENGYTRYYYNGKEVWSWYSGISTIKYNESIHNIYNQYFFEYKEEYLNYNLHWYELANKLHSETNITSLNGFVAIDNTQGTYGFIAFNRLLNSQELKAYELREKVINIS